MKTRKARIGRVLGKNSLEEVAGFDPSTQGVRISGEIAVYRRQIILEVVKHLDSVYGIEFSSDPLRDLVSSHAGIDALFSFRSDLRLNDLRAALTRLESGTFGVCIACKQQIEPRLLANDMTIRVCPSCEAGFHHHGSE